MRNAAELTGISRSKLGEIEHNSAKVKFPDLLKISNAYNIDPEKLFCSDIQSFNFQLSSM